MERSQTRIFEKSKRKKAQVWYLDYIVAVFIFVVAILLYFEVTSNLSKEEEGNLNEMTLDGTTITTSLLSEGYPKNWTAGDIERIGIIANDRLNPEKWNKLGKIDYNDATYLFGTIYKFYIFFENRAGDTEYIGKRCGYGSPTVNLVQNYTEQYAHYSLTTSYSDILPKLENVTEYNESTQTEFINELRNYKLIILENPRLPLEFEANVSRFVSAGGVAIVSGQLFANNTYSFAGVTFENHTTCGNSTVIGENYFINLSIGDNVNMQGCTNIIGADEVIANRTNTSSSIAVLHPDSGTIYYWGSFNGTVGTKPVSEIAAELVSFYREGTCTKLQPESIVSEDLTSITRYVAYHNEILKMVTYIWD